LFPIFFPILFPILFPVSSVFPVLLAVLIGEGAFVLPSLAKVLPYFRITGAMSVVFFLQALLFLLRWIALRRKAVLVIGQWRRYALTIQMLPVPVSALLLPTRTPVFTPTR
jgi:hypothetical protein